MPASSEQFMPLARDEPILDLDQGRREDVEDGSKALPEASKEGRGCRPGPRAALCGAGALCLAVAAGVAAVVAATAGRPPHVAPVVAQSVPNPELIMLDKALHPHARCMDGSQYGYFWQKASAEADTANWVIFMQGGGQCITQEGCNRTCSSKEGQEFLCSMKFFEATAQLDTSATWEERFVPMSSAFLSANASLNPIMATWNHVYLSFCSQDWWTGTRSEATNATFGYYFSGHLIMEAVISDLKQRAQLASAGSVVLTGSSSGGVGVNLHADWLKEQLPNVKVLAAPIAGFYGIQYLWPDPAKPLSLAPMNVETVPSYVKLWNSFLPPACVASLKEQDMEPSLCLLSSFVSQTHTVPKFVIQSQTDTAQLLLRGFPPPQATMVNFATEISSVQQAQKTTMMPNQTMINEIYASMRTEYKANATMLSFLNAWKMNQTVNLGPALKPGDGLFSPACFIHTSFFPATPLIDEFSYVTAFDKWYADGTEVRLTDDCGLLCGTCSLSAFGLSE